MTFGRLSAATDAIDSEVNAQQKAAKRVRFMVVVDGGSGGLGERPAGRESSIAKFFCVRFITKTWILAASQIELGGVSIIDAADGSLD